MNYLTEKTNVFNYKNILYIIHINSTLNFILLFNLHVKVVNYVIILHKRFDFNEI